MVLARAEIPTDVLVDFCFTTPDFTKETKQERERENKRGETSVNSGRRADPSPDWR